MWRRPLANQHLQPIDHWTDVLRNRLISGFSLAAGIIGLMAVDGWLTGLVLDDRIRWNVANLNIGIWLCNGLAPAILVAALTWLLARELITLANARGYRPLRFESQFFALGLVLGPYISYNLRETGFGYDESWGGLWLAIALGYAFWMQAVRRGAENAMGNIAATMFIIFYAGGLGGYLTKLRMEIGSLPAIDAGGLAGAEGATVLLLSMFLVKITDVGAFFTGTFLGRNKMIPWLSPKKTWEGLGGGILTAVGFALLLGNACHAIGLLPHFESIVRGQWGLIAIGVLMAAFGTAGDLAASLLKRDAAVKDSSELIPGMGGVLDILDSPLLAAPAAWFFWTRIAPVAF
jgi:phosphatidate cytidylyltransferase